MARSNEPIVWSLFAAGGVVAALFGPVLIFILGLGGTLGWLEIDASLSYERMRTLVSHPLTRLVLFVVITLTMFHWAHRFRYVLVDLGLRAVKKPLAVVCYAVALTVMGLTAAVLWTL